MATKTAAMSCLVVLLACLDMVLGFGISLAGDRRVKMLQKLRQQQQQQDEVSPPVALPLAQPYQVLPMRALSSPGGPHMRSFLGQRTLDVGGGGGGVGAFTQGATPAEEEERGAAPAEGPEWLDQEGQRGQRQVSSHLRYKAITPFVAPVVTEGIHERQEQDEDEDGAGRPSSILRQNNRVRFLSKLLSLQEANVPRVEEVRDVSRDRDLREGRRSGLQRYGVPVGPQDSLPKIPPLLIKYYG